MSAIKTYPLPNSSILRLNSEKELINVSPDYQRQGGIWNLEKKQLLIDSILNDYDIPKLYFHVLTPQQKVDSGEDYDYAIIDGRQRIEAIWQFIEGEFPLSDDFEYQVDPKVDAARLTYPDLAKEYPKIKIRFDSYTLPVTLVETDDTDLIEDMFSRLNEAVPLTGAEKRNSYGGPMAKTIREVASHNFFRNLVRFKNNRYQHQEIAARLLFIEESLNHHGKIVDTKKPYLDKLVSDYRDENKSTDIVYNATMNILDKMEQVFSNSDYLLRAQAMITVYYVTFKNAVNNNTLSRITRGALINFFDALNSNRLTAANDITLANYEYLEFDRMSQQGTNDASSIRERTRILSEYLGV
ncbi:MAG: DUF262 domain-containing protein [Flavobacterium sp.]|nr:MAG: DUF262 domain-containing protein [Flavobacterium sp.]